MLRLDVGDTVGRIVYVEQCFFFVFRGYKNTQLRKKHVIATGIECWNLRKMKFDEFISEISTAIAPRNPSMTEASYLQDHHFRITSAHENDINKIKAAWKPYYELASWGLLIKIKTNSWAKKVNHHIRFPITDQYLEDNALFLINLFSPYFLHPIFIVNDMGFHSSDIPYGELKVSLQDQQQAPAFKSQNFVKFLNELSRMDYTFYNLLSLEVTGTGSQGMNDLYKILRKKKIVSQEEYRAARACCLFDQLKKYSCRGKNHLNDKEYVEFCTILETLITFDGRSGASYKLSKRITLMLGNVLKNVDIDDEIAGLTKKRNNFIHGTSFSVIEAVDHADFLKKYKELFRSTELFTKITRFVLVGYLYLLKQKQFHLAFRNISKNSIPELLDSALLDIKLRSKLQMQLRKIYSLMPK